MSISKEAREAAITFKNWLPTVTLPWEIDRLANIIQLVLDAQRTESEKRISELTQDTDQYLEDNKRLLATITELRAECVDFRDSVLNGRNQLESPCLDNDQTNAVLTLFDAHFPAPQQGDKAP